MVVFKNQFPAYIAVHELAVTRSTHPTIEHVTVSGKFMSQFPFSEQRVHWLFPNEQRLYLYASPENADLSTFVVRINYRVYADCEPVFEEPASGKIGQK